MRKVWMIALLLILATATVAFGQYRLETSRIAVEADRATGLYYIELIEGDSSMCLIHPGYTSFANFFIDGEIYGMYPGSTELPYIGFPVRSGITSDSTAIFFDWDIGLHLTLTELLSPFDFTYTVYDSVGDSIGIDTAGAVSIQYYFQNVDPINPHIVGILEIIDTDINGRDDAPFWTSAGYSDHVTCFPSDTIDYVPLEWIAYEFDMPFSDSGIAAHMDMSITPPNFLVLGNWRRLAITHWDDFDCEMHSDSLITDSGVLMRWNPVTRNPGETFYTNIIYGEAGGAAFYPGFVSFRLMRQIREIRVVNCELRPNPFSINAVATNSMPDTLSDVVIRLRLPEGLHCDPATPETAAIISTFLPYRTVPVNWRVHVDPPAESDVYLTYVIEATTSTYPGLVSEAALDVFVEYSSYIPPEIEVLEPVSDEPTRDLFSSNEFQGIIFTITDDEGVDTSSIKISAGLIGSTAVYPYSSGTMHFSGDTLFFNPPEPFLDGTHVIFKIVSAADYDGCSADTSGVYDCWIDLSGPVWTDYYPYDDDLITDSLETIVVFVHDALQGKIYLPSVVFSINDDSISYPSPLISYDPDEDSLSLTPDGETILEDGYTEVCLLDVTDHPDYGEPNHLEGGELCWFFTVNSHGPRAHPIEPMPDHITSNPNQVITVSLFDGNEVVPSSIVWYVNDDTMTATPLEEDSLLVYTPPSPWENCEVVTVGVISAMDTLGTELESPLNFAFVVDLTPPYVVSTFPEDGDTSEDMHQIIYVILGDECGRLNPELITMTVNGVTYSLSEPGLSLTGDTLIFNPEEAGIYFPMFSTVNVVVNAGDLPDIGDPNVMEPYSFSFRTYSDYPSVLFTTPTSNSIVCDPELPVEIELYDASGIEEDSLLISMHTSDGDFSYTIDDPELSFSEGIATLTHTPWIEGDTVEVCVDRCYNTTGSWLPEPVCIRFFVNPDTAYIAEFEVIPGDPESTRPDTLSDITIVLAGGELDFYTTELSIGDDTFTVDSPGISVDAETRTIRFNSGDADYIWGCTADSCDITVCVTIESFCDFGHHEPYTLCQDVVIYDIWEQSGAIPRTPVLFQNRPNPFNPITEIVFGLPEEDEIELAVFNINGQKLSTLASGRVSAGFHRLSWNAKDLPSGIYIYQLKTSNYRISKRMLLVR
ncbi:T9SS type A sorting domain-containing protein [bacterium]|nr:T9SS type A sorting domain-containing protein [bacterium]